MSSIIVLANEKAIALGEPVARFSGPPATRVQGRKMARAKRAAIKQGSLTAKGALTLEDGTVVGGKQPVPGTSEVGHEMFSEKEQVLQHAIHTGVIAAGMKEHYSALWEADPAGTRQYLFALGLDKAGLNPDLPGIAETTEPPGEAEGGLPELAMLSKAERKRIADAKAGKRATPGTRGRIVHGC